MTSIYRDDLEAAHLRVSDLEQQVAGLRAQVKQLETELAGADHQALVKRALAARRWVTATPRERRIAYSYVGFVGGMMFLVGIAQADLPFAGITAAITGVLLALISRVGPGPSDVGGR